MWQPPPSIHGSAHMILSCNKHHLRQSPTLVELTHSCSLSLACLYGRGLRPYENNFTILFLSSGQHNNYHFLLFLHFISNCFFLMWPWSSVHSWPVKMCSVFSCVNYQWPVASFHSSLQKHCQPILWGWLHEDIFFFLEKHLNDGGWEVKLQNVKHFYKLWSSLHFRTFLQWTKKITGCKTLLLILRKI